MAFLVAGCFGSKSSPESLMADLQRLQRQLESSGAAAPLGAGEHATTGPGTVEYTINGAADATVNRDISGKSLSLVLRVYQLKDKTDFTQITYTNAISKHDNELLPKDLLARNEWVLIPGSTLDVVDSIQPETRYLGLIGYFREPDAQSWRVIVDADAVRKEGLSFEVRDCYLGSVYPKAVPLPGQVGTYSPECPAFPSTRR